MQSTSDYLEIDFSDLPAMRKVMDNYHHLTTMLIGKSDSGEDTYTSVNSDHIVHDTFQKNGWVRRNILWYDGTSEEMYPERWK